MWFGNHLEKNKNLTVINADIRKIELIPMKGVDVIIHLANIANDPSGDLNPKLTWEVNVLASKLLIEKAIINGVKQFIYASSGSVYGVKNELQVTEDLNLLPISDYNKSKMISERVLLSYNNKIKLVIIRPATVCGYSPRMRLDLSVSMLTMQALTKNEITVFGGDQIRPNIHMKDMIGVYLHFLKIGNKTTGIFNAGFENTSIIELANNINKILSTNICIKKTNDIRSYRQNSDKLILTKFVPKHTVNDAIKEIIQLYQKNILVDKEIFYNIKQMKKLINFNKI